jgi:hypothetical protein
MVTLAEEDEVQPSSVERHVRFAIAGHERGAVRRIILYVIVLVLVIAGVWWSYAAIAAVAALMLLAMTDQLA